VLIIKPSSLGDVVSAIALPAGLRRTFPHAHIAWLVVPSCADILRGQPKIDELVIFDRRHYGRMSRNLRAAGDFLAFCRQLRAKQFDWAIDLQGLFRSGVMAWISRAKVRAGFADARELSRVFYTHAVKVDRPHTVDRNIQLAWSLGIDVRPEDFRLAILPEAAQQADALLARHGLKPRQFILAVPGARRENKMYPPQRWRELLGLLGRPVVLTGAANEQELCRQVAEDTAAVNLAGQTTLPVLAAMMARAQAVICVDSAANFIAPAVGAPHLELVGPTDPLRTGPYRSGRAVAAQVPCQGCLRRRCRRHVCMDSIAPKRVAAELEALLASGRTKEAGMGQSEAGDWAGRPDPTTM
jgi:lipopolysaccharide heptosyltransferase I